MNLSSFIMQIPAAFFALVLHEMTKARCSTWLGDPTPKNSGLMSGNPFKYLEPIGYILTVVFGFGWGRPTPTSPMYYKDIKKGILITYLTPSLVNLAAGLLAALLSGTLNVAAAQLGAGLQQTFMAYVVVMLATFAHCSVAIALFNMIPVPPLGAAKLLQAALSPNAAIKMTQNEKVLQIILMMLIMIGLISRIIGPIAEQIVRAAWLF